jgi:hypothetical protein
MMKGFVVLALAAVARANGRADGGLTELHYLPRGPHDWYEAMKYSMVLWLLPRSEPAADVSYFLRSTHSLNESREVCHTLCRLQKVRVSPGTRHTRGIL